MKTASYDLPTHWSYYLTYGRDDVMEDAERAAIDRFMEDNCLLPVLEVGDETWFAHHHDASDYGVKGCQVCLCTFPVKASA